MSNRDSYLNAKIKHHKAILDGTVKQGTKRYFKLKAIMLATELKHNLM